MRNAMRILGQAVKAALVVVAASIGRISRAEGKGVFEEAVQTAIYQVADYYVRSVRSA